MSTSTVTSASDGQFAAQPERGSIPGAGWCLALVATSVFMLILDVTIVSAALADIRADFNASIDGLQWVIDAYALPLAGAMLAFAALGDRHGRRLLFLAGMSVFTLSSLALSLSGTILVLNLLRAVQGVGAAMLFAAALPLLAVAYPGRDARLKAIGIYGAVLASASVAGPVVGGALVTAFGWRSVFIVNVPIGIAVIALALLKMPESVEPSSRRTDWLGSTLLTASLVSGVFALTRGNAWGWTSPEVLGLAIGSVVLLAAFVAWQVKAPDPMFDGRMVRQAGFTGTAIVSIVYSATIMAVVTYLALFFINVYDYTPLEMGLRILPLSVTAFVAAPISAAISKKVPYSITLPATMVLVALGLWLMTGLDAGDSWTHYIPGMVIAGVGLGGIAAISNSAALSFAPDEQAGVAGSTFGTFRQVGLAMGIAGLGALFSNHAQDQTEKGLDGMTAGTTLQVPAELRDKLVEAVGSGAGNSVVDEVPAQFAFAAPRLTTLANDASRDALNTIFTYSAWIGFGGAVATAVAFWVGGRLTRTK